MTDATTAQRVNNQLADFFNAEIGLITPETELVSTFDFDSLDSIEVVMLLEEEFDIEIPDAETEGWKTVGHIHATIEKLTNG